MLSFISKSFFTVALFSILRFFIGVYFASFIFPSDYAVILVPLLLFTFIDIYIEGGYLVSIIKLGVNEEEEKRMRRVQFKKFLMAAPLLLILFFFYDLYHSDKLLPFYVVVNYCLISYMKIYTYTKEGLLVAKGRYIFVETIGFLASFLTYILIFYLIFNSSLTGYYLLCLLHSVYALIYALFIHFYSQKLYFEKGNSFDEISEFARTNRNVALVFAMNDRIDELAASNVLGLNQLGLFAKFKEMALGFGALTSKVITKPWFYVACNSTLQYTKKIYLYALLGFIVSFACIYPICIYFINALIGLMGENWATLLNYDNQILVFLFFYFLSEFAKSTLLAKEGEDFLFNLEKIFFIFRIATYSILLISSYFGFFQIILETFIIIELLYRAVFLISENIKLILIFNKVSLTNK